jgi:hypothetical protein
LVEDRRAFDRFVKEAIPIVNGNLGAPMNVILTTIGNGIDELVRRYLPKQESAWRHARRRLFTKAESSKCKGENDAPEE